MHRSKTKRKSAWDRDPEKLAAADAVLRGSRKLLRHPDHLFRLLAEGGSVRLPLRTDLGVIAAVLEGAHRGGPEGDGPRPDLEILGRLLLFCRDRTDLLTAQESARYADALLALAFHHRDWIRPLDDWLPGSHNAHRQFQSLLRHLIARYDVPRFLDVAWFEGLTPEGIRHQGWYKLVGGGGNIRTAPDLPFAMTKKQAHHFLQAPDDFDIPSALRRAVVVDLGGDERLVRSILGTRVGTEFDAEDFWVSVFRFFIAHPTIDHAQHGPIVDYLQHQRFPPRDDDSPGASAAGRAPRPHLSMKGRTPESLLRAIGAWHHSLSRSRAVSTSRWPESGFPGFTGEFDSDEAAQPFEIVELLTTQELFEEGRAMHHCVGSYIDSCESRRTSIWSLRKRLGNGRIVRVITAEVSNIRRAIVQARGKWNKPPTAGDRAILKQWGEAGGPRLSQWLV